MPPLSNDTVLSPPQARKKILTYRETKTAGKKYIAKNVRTSNSQPSLQIPQTPIQNLYEMFIAEHSITGKAENTHPPKGINLHRYFYMV
jgi:hypothetical protein